MEYVELNQMLPFWRPEKGEQLEGKVSDFRTIEGQFGLQEVVNIACYTVGLSSVLKPLKNLVGQNVRLTYEGFVPTEGGQSNYKMFKIEVEAKK